MERAGTLMTLSDIARGTGGVTLRRGRRPVTSVVIDSRAGRECSLFVPLAGERVNGHDFIPQALERGASAALVGIGYWRENMERLAELFARRDVSCVVVDDTLAALQDLARFHLAQFPGLFRIGVTGSSGKTTTKELIGAVLSKFAPVMVSEGNLNSEIGVPLSAFAVRPGHRFAVFEMGINHPGEMDVLASIVRPTLAVITNIGTAHIGLLGSQSAIAAEKKKIASFLGEKDALFVFEDEPFFEDLSRDTGGMTVRYGPRSTQGYTGSRDLGLDGSAIDWEGLQIRFPLAGKHNLRNAFAALAVAARLGVPAPLVKEGLEGVTPLFGRSQVIRGRVTIIEDCYNANPDSMEQALSLLGDIRWPGRKVAVLGAMRELGGETRARHRTLGTCAASLELELVLFFGAEAEDAWDAFAAALGPAAETRGAWCAEYEELERRVMEAVRDGDLVLVKGSRALALERLTRRLSDRPGTGGNA
jgi:UDP-N-acetylmuramoyl-tripeptide--D-alanyl-D-alanine ligase